MAYKWLLKLVKRLSRVLRLNECLLITLKADSRTPKLSTQPEPGGIVRCALSWLMERRVAIDQHQYLLRS